MKSHPLSIGALCLGLLALIGGPAHSFQDDNPSDPRMLGDWQGKLQSSGMSLRVVFHIAAAPDGALKATFDSPDQGVFGLAVDNVAVTGDTVRCEVQAIRAEYEGNLKPGDTGGRFIDGYLTQFGIPIPLRLEPVLAAKLKRPQEPAPPVPYDEEAVAFQNTQAGIGFAGTLTRPTKGGKLPAVLLISGSNPHDRNAAVMEHKPFWVLADYLTRQGIAVLRVDDRGVGGSGRGRLPPSSVDSVQDALAGLKYLRSRRDIDRKHIGLIGHAEGGLVGLLTAAQSKDASFLVLLAAPGMRGADVLLQENEAMQAAQGIPSMVRQLNARLLRRLIEIALASPDEASAVASFDAYWSERTRQSSGPFVPSDTEASMMELLGNQQRDSLRQFKSPWMDFYLKYDPAPDLARLKQPVLALSGSLDKEVPAAQNLPAIEAALKAGGNPQSAVKELAGLNHLFQAAKTGAMGEYREIEETINPAALEEIAVWIAARAGHHRK